MHVYVYIYIYIYIYTHLYIYRIHIVYIHVWLPCEIQEMCHQKMAQAIWPALHGWRRRPLVTVAMKVTEPPPKEKKQVAMENPP